MDLLVKFMFNEPNNSLTVSLISYRKLFVFQDNTRYSRAVWCFKLRPNKLSYVVESDEQARYKLTKALRKSIKPRRKHIFKRWIEYEGLQPQPTDYKMVNDYIEQTFDILHKEAPVSITLRDILVMNEQITSKKKKYDLFYQTDLNRKYEITIKRDPCFGKEEALQAAIVRAENIQTSLLYLGGIVGALLDSRAEDCAFDGALPALGGEGQYIQAGDLAGNIQGTSKEVNQNG